MARILKNLFKHLLMINIHKFYVCLYCFKAGIFWRGIKHDISKFHPIEFFESIKFYDGKKSPIVNAKNSKGYSLAWQHHKGHNTHHYEYWVDKLDDGGVAIKMPYKDVIELVCDYIGAGRAYLKNNFTYELEYEWWLNKLKNEHPKIHKETANIITFILFKFKEKNSFYNVFEYAQNVMNY